MEEPEEILKRIMEFEESYTPQFTNLIKQSIVDNVSLDIEDDPDGDNFPQLPQQNPITRTSTSDTKIIEISQERHKAQSPLQSFLANQPNLDKQAISLSTPMPNTMPSYNKQKPNNRQATPIISRSGSSQNTIKKFDQNSFINLEDLQYNSSEEGSDEDRFGVPKQNGTETGGGGGGNEMEEDLTNRFGNYGDSEEDDFEDEEVDPLIEEYDSISHEIHKSKLRLRKIDRQMTVAQRNGTSTSDLVKQHSDIKIKIAQLISKRRKLETHDVVRAHIKEDDTPTVEIGGDGPGGTEQPALLEAGLMEINEDEEEEDEEQEVRNNNISPTTQSAQTSDSDPTDDQLKGLFNGMNGYGDDPSRSTLENFDYSYDAKGDDDDEDDMETGSVQFHSSPDEDDDEDGGGSVQYHSSVEEEDEEEESDGGGSMQMHPDVENNEDWFGDDTQNGAYDDDEEDDDGSGGGGSVQMNDVENNENWVDEEFDTKSIEIRASDDEENQEMDKKMDDMLESVDIVNEARTMINKENDIESGQDNKEDVTQDEKKEEVKFDGDMGNIIRSGGRSRRLEQMKKHRNHKDHKTDLNDLNGLKQKYHDRRRHRERIEVGLFSINDLVKGDSHDEEIDDAEFSLEQFVKDNKEMVENMDEDDDDEEDGDDGKDELDEDRDDGKDEEKKMDPYRFDDDHDDEFNVPALPKKKKSVVLDIEKYSSNLAAVIEEDGDDDDDEEKYFQTVEYQTDSDCDSNDSVVVKKEILKNVTVNDLQKFDTV